MGHIFLKERLFENLFLRSVRASYKNWLYRRSVFVFVFVSKPLAAVSCVVWVESCDSGWFFIGTPCRRGPPYRTPAGRPRRGAYLTLHSAHRKWQTEAYITKYCYVLRDLLGHAVWHKRMVLLRVYLAVSTAVTSASPAQQLWIVGPCGEDWVGSESEQDQTFKTQQTFK